MHLWPEKLQTGRCRGKHTNFAVSTADIFMKGQSHFVMSKPECMAADQEVKYLRSFATIAAAWPG